MPLRGCERVSMNNSIERCACCNRALATHTHVHAGAGALPSTRQHTVHGSSDTHEAHAGFAAMGNAMRRRAHTQLWRQKAHSTPATHSHTHARPSTAHASYLAAPQLPRREAVVAGRRRAHTQTRGEATGASPPSWGDTKRWRHASPPLNVHKQHTRPQGVIRRGRCSRRCQPVDPTGWCAAAASSSA